VKILEKKRCVAASLREDARKKRCVAASLREDARQKNVASPRRCVKMQDKKTLRRRVAA